MEQEHATTKKEQKTCLHHIHLNATKDTGLVYWHTEPCNNLPFVKHPKPVSNPTETLCQIPMDPVKLVSLMTLIWGSDRVTPR